MYLLIYAYSIMIIINGRNFCFVVFMAEKHKSNISIINFKKYIKE